MEIPFPMPNNGIISTVQEAEDIISWIDNVLMDFMGEVAATADAVIDGCTLGMKELYTDLRSGMYKPVNKIKRDLTKVQAMIDSHLPLEVYDNGTQNNTIRTMVATDVQESTSVSSQSGIQSETMGENGSANTDNELQTLTDGSITPDPTQQCQNGQVRDWLNPVTGCTEHQFCMNGAWVTSSYTCPPPPGGNGEPPPEPSGACQGIFPVESNCLNVIGGWEYLFRTGGQFALEFVQGNSDHPIDNRTQLFYDSVGAGGDAGYRNLRAIPVVAYQANHIPPGKDTVWGAEGEAWIKGRMPIIDNVERRTQQYDSMNEYIDQSFFVEYPWVPDDVELSLPIYNI